MKPEIIFANRDCIVATWETLLISAWRAEIAAHDRMKFTAHVKAIVGGCPCHFTAITVLDQACDPSRWLKEFRRLNDCTTEYRHCHAHAIVAISASTRKWLDAWVHEQKARCFRPPLVAGTVKDAAKFLARCVDGTPMQIDRAVGMVRAVLRSTYG